MHILDLELRRLFVGQQCGRLLAIQYEGPDNSYSWFPIEHPRMQVHCTELVEAEGIHHGTALLSLEVVYCVLRMGFTDWL